MLVRQVLWPNLTPEGITVLPKLEEGTLHIPRLEQDLTDLTQDGVRWYTEHYQMSTLSMAR